MIKLILVIAAIYLFIKESQTRQSHRLQAIRRLIFVILLLLTLTFVVFPEYLSRVANYLGVGRGTDLLIYVLIVAIALVFTRINAILIEYNRRLTKLSRYIAIKNVSAPTTISSQKKS